MSRCQGCLADPQPDNFASPRECAFEKTGRFNSQNWNCVSINRLRDAFGDVDINWDYEGVWCQVRRVEIKSLDGWLVLSGYKRRGRLKSCLLIHDGGATRAPDESECLEIIESFIRENGES